MISCCCSDEYEAENQAVNRNAARKPEGRKKKSRRDEVPQS